MSVTVALAGNPNAGKTTIFNALTGARQHVGNYPGVTVEKKAGTYIANGHHFSIVDLPGTYSLTAYSQEEVVARDFLVNEKPATVINIVDAANLERNLYLTVQFMEMGIPVCIALNMIDVAENRGVKIDIPKLSSMLGIPIVPTVARTGKGVKDLMDAAAEDHITGNKTQTALNITYGPDVDGALTEMTAKIEQAAFLTDTYLARWIALKYLENDQQIHTLGRQTDQQMSNALEKIVDKVSNHLKVTLNTYPEALIADHRYGYIKSIIKQGVIHFDLDQDRLFMSDRIDRVVTNRFAGPLIMAAVVWGLYQFTFTYSEIPVGWFENFFGWLSSTVSDLMPDGLLKSLIVSGIIDGVGGVLGFVPLIAFMFLGVSLIEDSGYLARMAFMLDRIFKTFGLHGSSVMAFIVSGGIAGGCAVPGIMATRTLKSPRERLATLLTVPFMNCGAKLPVFALLVAAFFAGNKALMMVILTALAWIGALLVAKLLRTTVIKGAATPFVMELPPYRLPTFKGLMIHTWERTWQYIRKAGTVILSISVLLWAMMTFPQLPDSRIADYSMQRQSALTAASKTAIALPQTRSQRKLTPAVEKLRKTLTEIDARQSNEALRNSIAGRFGIALENVSRWAGFDWRTNIALVGGFAAKEVVISTLGTAYSLGAVDPEESGSLADTLKTNPGWSPLVALSLIIFIMFYSPCFVSVVCIVREAGSWKWGFFAMVFNTVLAYILAVLVFQTGRILGF
jgi:ferrous iron transport protein B